MREQRARGVEGQIDFEFHSNGSVFPRLLLSFLAQYGSIKYIYIPFMELNPPLVKEEKIIPDSRQDPWVNLAAVPWTRNRPHPAGIP